MHRPLAPAIRAEAGRIWQLAWPILIGQLATVGMGVVDVAMSGHASAVDLAGVSLGVSIWAIAIMTLMGTILAVNPIVAQHVGAGARERIAPAVRQALWMALGLGVVVMLLANLAARVFDAMAIEPEVRAIATGVVWITGFSMPAFAVYRVLYGYSASLNQTKPMMVIALLALLLKVLGNWLLVHGRLGLPALGGMGCAWTTLACTGFNVAAMVLWIRRAAPYRDCDPFAAWERPSWPVIRSQLRIGLPIGVTYFAESSAFSLIALLVASFGAVQVGAHQIALNFASLVFMVPMSLGVALMTRVGQAIGSGALDEARFRGWVGVGMAFGCASVSALTIALLREQIAAAYTSDAAVAALAAQLLLFAALFQLPDALQVSTSCAIRAYKVTRLPMVIHLAAFWGLCLPLGVALGRAPDWLPWRPAAPMAAYGFWIALVAGLAIAAAGLTLLLNRLSLQRAREAAHRPPSAAAAGSGGA